MASPRSRHSYALGLLLVVAVAVAWVVTDVVVKFIFGQTDYKKPFLVSWVSTSLFSVFAFSFIHGGPRSSSRTAPKNNELSLIDTFKFAVIASPWFFITSYTYNLGLFYSTMSSSSALNATTTLFSLLLGISLGTDQPTFPNIIGTILTTFGVFAISFEDLKVSRDRMLGDVFNLVSAITYSIYSVVIDYHTRGKSVNVLHLQAFMGMIIMVAGVPLLFIFHLLGFESFSSPSPHVSFMLLLNGLLGTVICEYCFTLSVILTSPIVASMAVSLSIPMTVYADSFMYDIHYDFKYLFGTVLVIFAFFIVTSHMTRREEQLERMEYIPIKTTEIDGLDA